MVDAFLLDFQYDVPHISLAKQAAHLLDEIQQRRLIDRKRLDCLMQSRRFLFIGWMPWAPK